MQTKNKIENQISETKNKIENQISEPKKDVKKITFNMVRPVKIFPYQTKHFNNVIDILKRECAYLDVSPFGAGKTHIVFGIAATFGLDIVGVGPKTTIENWRKWGKIYGVKIHNFITYQSLRGSKGSKLNHDLMTKIEGPLIDTEYVPTDLFNEYAKKGILLVFDEVHNVKNDNSQLAASHALVKAVVNSIRLNCKSRIALLSATPSDTKENVTSILKMLGVITSKKLYNYNRSTKYYEPLGIQEAINKCNVYDSDETMHIFCRPLNKTTAKTMCHDLYTRILKRHVTSSMPRPPIKAVKDVKNFYVKMSPKNIERMKNGLLMFSSATNYEPATNEISLAGVNWGDVTRSRREIDSAKVDSVCRLTIKNLVENPHCKVILYFNYIRDIKEGVRQLSKYNPLVMFGETKEKERQDLISKFQSESDEFRIMISNPKVGGIGIDLDDKEGSRPRIMYILPSYFFTDQFQAGGRSHRNGTKSKAIVRFIYSKDFPYETGILNSMIMKSKVTKSMLTDTENEIIFPGEYAELIEDDEQTDISDTG